MPGLHLESVECGWVRDWLRQDASVRHATALLHLALPLSAPNLDFPRYQKVEPALVCFEPKETMKPKI